jgi:hypothetical protein
LVIGGRETGSVAGFGTGRAGAHLSETVFRAEPGAAVRAFLAGNSDRAATGRVGAVPAKETAERGGDQSSRHRTARRLSGGELCKCVEPVVLHWRAPKEKENGHAGIDLPLEYPS